MRGRVVLIRGMLERVRLDPRNLRVRGPATVIVTEALTTRFEIITSEGVKRGYWYGEMHRRPYSSTRVPADAYVEVDFLWLVLWHVRVCCSKYA